MAGVPAYCPSCKSSFISNLFDISESLNISLAGNLVPCPNCPGTARVIDGTISVKNEKLELISGPKWSYEVLDRLRAAAEKASSTEDAELLLKEVSNVSPALADALRPIAKTKSFWFLIAVLLVITRININFNIDIDVNEIVRSAIEEVHSQDHKEIAKSELKTLSRTQDKSELKTSIGIEAKLDVSKLIEDRHLSKRKRQRLRGTRRAAKRR